MSRVGEEELLRALQASAWERLLEEALAKIGAQRSSPKSTRDVGSSAVIASIPRDRPSSAALR
jgi:hypothetical protein